MQTRSVRDGKPSINATAGARVGIVVNNVGGYSRGVLKGVATYATSRAWRVRLEGVTDTDIGKRRRDYDGLIVQAATRDQVRRLGRASIPVVNVSSALGLRGVPSVVSDDIAVGRLGAEHLIRLGFRRYGFFAIDDRQFAKLRHDGFRRSVVDAGFLCLALDSMEALRMALNDRTMPLAIMACNDRAALTVLDQAREAGSRVPDDVAVLGVDNDELMQSLSNPPLSTINTARERIGFEAGAMLDRLLSGLPVADPLRLIAPKNVIARRSTDAAATRDGDVGQAVRYIHQRACGPLDVDDVAAQVAVSRRQLERRFKQSMGHTIGDEIARRRIDRARQLLIDTDLTLPQVAEASGFQSASYFSVAFRAAVGETPGGFRKRCRIE
jgi:LacI family transcriptional regulator